MNNNPPKVLIIGGGVSGMTAGIYLQKKGYDVEIIEKNAYLGGLCTGWTRKGSYIDGCIHWLTESGHGELNAVMRELGLVTANNIINLDAYSQTNLNGKPVNLYTNPDKLRTELLKYAKGADAEKMELFVKYVKKCRNNLITAGRPYHYWNLWDKLKFIGRILPLIGVMKNFAKITIGEFAQQLESEDLKFFFNNSPVPKEYSMFSLLNTLGGICDKNGGLPMGGSKGFAETLAAKYKNAGGKVRTNCNVKRIIVENDSATGIELENGEVVNCDYMISACDLHYTLDNLFEKKYEIKRLTEYDENKSGAPIYSMYLISCRTKKDLSKINVNRYFNCEEFDVLGKKHNSIYVKHFGYDQTLIKDGYTVVQVIADTREDEYDKVAQMDKETYKAFKEELGQKFLNVAQKATGEDYGELELIDVCTPTTFAHWVNGYKGTFMTYMLTNNNKQLILRNDILPLKNFALAGHWLMMPGGIPIAILQGKFAASTIEYKRQHPDKFDKSVSEAAMNQSSKNVEGSKFFKRNV